MITPVRTDPFIFQNKVNEAGYEWVKGLDGSPRLIPRHIHGSGFRMSEPHPGLFRDFAVLAVTREAIQNFANNFGDLLSRYDTSQSARNAGGMISHGASLDTWKREIGDMRVLVSLWDQTQYRQISELKKVIKWTSKAVGYVLKTPRRERDVTLAHADIPQTRLSRFSRKDVVLPARCALQQEINFRLAGDPSPIPQLAWTPDSHQRIIFTPPNLLSVMWLQFAQAVTEEFQLRKCEGCGKYFQIGPGGKRTDAVTCSDACRQRKKRAMLPTKKSLPGARGSFQE